MKAAIVQAAGQAPVYGDFADPVAAPGQRRIRVSASSISQVTRSRASGRHYSADGAFPLVPGIDGTGVAEDGSPVYFFMPPSPWGAMAEYCVVDAQRVIALPPALDPVTAAAMTVPGMSSWAALVERAQLRQGETVLVNGATGTSGRLALQVARHLGASKVIATGRRSETFDELRRLGADQTIGLTQPREALEASFRAVFEQGVDVVLDYLWGPSAEMLVAAAARFGPEGVPIRYVQIGAASGADINLPSAALRSSALQLLGSGMGSIPLPRLIDAMRGVLTAAPSAGFEVATAVRPLADVSRAWAEAGDDGRVVLVP